MVTVTAPRAAQRLPHASVRVGYTSGKPWQKGALATAGVGGEAGKSSSESEMTTTADSAPPSLLSLFRLACSLALLVLVASLSLVPLGRLVCSTS